MPTANGNANPEVVATVAEQIEVANQTFATNRSVRARAGALRTETSALLLTYRAYRFARIAGGSDVSDNDRVRRFLHDFCSGDGQSKSYAGYSRGSVCQACGSAIRPGDLEYDVVTTTAELRLDALCYAVFMEVQRTMPGAAAP